MKNTDMLSSFFLAAGVAKGNLKRARSIYCFGSCLETVVLDILVSRFKNDAQVVEVLREKGEALKSAWFSQNSSVVLVEAYADGKLIHKLSSAVLAEEEAHDA